MSKENRPQNQPPVPKTVQPPKDNGKGQQNTVGVKQNPAEVHTTPGVPPTK